MKYDKFYKQHRKMKDKYGVKKTAIEFEGMKEDVFYLPFV
jgi:ERCC4-type nuclease